MGCPVCEEKARENSCQNDNDNEDLSPSLYINNTEAPVVFHTVSVSASQGDHKTFPPVQGAYKNTLLKYEADGFVYLYNSDGIYTELGGAGGGVSEFDLLQNRPRYNGEEMTSATNIVIDDKIDNTSENAVQNKVIAKALADKDADLTEINNKLTQEISDRTAGDTALHDSINAETSARQAGDTTLQTALTAETARAGEAEKTLQDNINAETQGREAADNTLQDNIDAEANTRKTEDDKLRDAINAEKSARENGTTDFQSKLDAEAEARKNADTDIREDLDTESSRAKKAEETLQSNIDTEANTREVNDTTLQTNIDNETSRAQTIEDDIQQRLNDLTQIRIDGDNDIQQEVDVINSKSDVVDVVGTKADLDNYDTLALTNKDVIKVLSDESHDGAITYYRWSEEAGAFNYIGYIGPYYTKAQVNTQYTDGSVKRLGTNTVGSGTNPIYLDAGTATKSTATVGDAHTPVYLKNGVITKVDTTVNRPTNANANRVPFVRGDGVMEIGQYVDFHIKGQENDYDARLQAVANQGIKNTDGDFLTNKGNSIDTNATNIAKITSANNGKLTINTSGNAIAFTANQSTDTTVTPVWDGGTQIKDQTITSTKLKGYSTANTTDTHLLVTTGTGQVQYRPAKPFNADGTIPASAIASKAVTSDKVDWTTIVKYTTSDPGKNSALAANHFTFIYEN